MKQIFVVFLGCLLPLSIAAQKCRELYDTFLLRGGTAQVAGSQRPSKSTVCGGYDRTPYVIFRYRLTNFVCRATCCILTQSTIL